MGPSFASLCSVVENLHFAAIGALWLRADFSYIPSAFLPTQRHLPSSFMAIFRPRAPSKPLQVVSCQTCLHAIALSRCNNLLHGRLDFNFRPVPVILPCTVRGGVLDSYPGHPRRTSGQLRFSSSTRVRLGLPAFLCE